MLAYTYYEMDNRVRRYAETLSKRGDSVCVIALKQKDQSHYEKINGVNVFRIQGRTIDEKTKISYLIKLIRFFIRSASFLTKEHIKEPFDLIHIHSVPDFLVFAAFIPKLFGSRIILDIHDIVPEFFRSKFNSTDDSLFFKGLILIEKLSSLFADHVIISNHIWYDILTSRAIDKSKCTTILNYPDSTIFYRRDYPTNNNKFIMLYPGTLNWHQGIDIAIKAFARIKDKAKSAEFHIYGKGPSEKELVSFINELGLENRIFIKGLVPIDKIPEIMSNVAVGIIPKRNDPFGGQAFSTKTLEFMNLGIPVIVSKTKIDQYYFDESILKFFNPGDDEDLSKAMLELINNHTLRDNLSKNALRFMEKNNWEANRHLYLDLVDSLVKTDN